MEQYYATNDIYLDFYEKGINATGIIMTNLTNIFKELIAN